MNDTEESADRIPDLPIEPCANETATDCEDYAAAISEGWPVSPDPHYPKIKSSAARMIGRTITSNDPP